MPTSNPNWVTPNRHTRLILDYQSPVSFRPPWQEFRRGKEMRATKTAVAETVDTMLQPSGWITLAPHRNDITRVIDSGYGGAIGAADVNVAAHFGFYDTWRNPSELTGIGAAGTVLSSGVPALRRQTPAGASWAQELSGDVGAVPKPVLGSADYPMDRILSGKVTYPANQPWALLFGPLPLAAQTPDSVLTFYFGGQTTQARRTSAPSVISAGHYALNYRGNGETNLYEQVGGVWLPRAAQKPPDPPPVGALHALHVVPHGPQHLTLQAPNLSGLQPDPLPPAHPFLLRLPRPPRPPGVVYTVNPGVTGYTPTESVTGPGNIRLDIRRGLRMRVTLVQLKYPASGTWCDSLFWIPYPIPTHSTLTVYAETHTPPGTSVSVQLYNARDDSALTLIGSDPPKFQTPILGASQAYYAVFTFTSDTDRRQTPALLSYRVGLDALGSSLASSSTTGGNIKSCSVTGPDLDGQSDTANLRIEDPLNALAILRGRNRIPGRVAVYNDAGSLTSVLLEGEVSLSPGTRKGKPGRVYPSPYWNSYDVSMVGKWSRLNDQINLARIPFFEDTDAAKVNGAYPPWKVTDIIRYLLGGLGYTSAELDIPDINIRLFREAGNNLEDFILQPTVNIGEFINSLCQRYLNMTLLWCGNSGAAGMWRLVPNTTSASNILAAFLGGPASGGKLSMHPNSYAAGTAPIIEDSYREDPKAPEGNYVIVYGVEAFTGSKMASSMYNPVSFDFLGATSDPTSIDYLGRFVPIVHCDPTLTTKNATAFIARRIYNFACHGFLWLKWRAPLLFVTNPLDSHQTRVRPLRIQDAVTVLGQNVIIQGTNINYTHDGIALCDYEGIRVP